MMKSTKLLFTILTLVIMTSYGCSDDSPTNPKPDIEPPTAAAFKALQDAAMDARTQTTQFNAQDGISFTSEKGVELNIPGICLYSNGQPVSGQVTLTYVEMFDRSTMLVTNKPTMGLDENGDKKLLISGGEFSITLTQNGVPVELYCPMHADVPASLTGGPDPAMKLWQGKVDQNGNLGWSPAPNHHDSTGVDENGISYTASIGDFGYTNVDRFVSDPRPKTTLQVRPPEGYDADNSAIYLTYDGEDHALAQLDRYNENTGVFSEHYGQVPIGLNMHIIFVTEDNGQWRYAVKGVIVADNDQYAFTQGETVSGSKQDLVDAIKALP